MNNYSRVNEFRKMGIGLFVHFGLYNKISKGEWYMNMYGLSIEQYKKDLKIKNKFDLQLDIKKVIQVAKENGFKYIVLTSKHHDGFCLFDSKKQSQWDINDTISQKDILKEFIEECIKNDIKPFVYYATLDWSWDEAKISFEEQLIKINIEIENILLNYPKVAGFWFDGNWSRKDENWKEDALYSLIRKYNPECMIINNSGLSNAGTHKNPEVDSITFEQGNFKKIDYSNFSRDLAAEACQSFNDHWGYAKEDYNFKSPEYLIKKFIEARKQKANYLLNVSIDENGKMLQYEIESIKIFDKWVEKYAKFLFEDYEVISYSENDFIIKTYDEKFYGFMYNLPSGGHVKVIQNGGKKQPIRTFELNSVIPEIKEIIFLDNKESLVFENKNNMLSIEPTAFNYGYNTIIRVFEIKTNN
ncbi:alpha-L-fucosidase [Mesoplasma florum]|uniref:alpha-L-fucosidase n=1 Tax=Mesoplasma florum TaxID=2151 RepID=UPI00131A0C76|nr:alpha-L-fucosidase [Mesoplasma florum]